MAYIFDPIRNTFIDDEDKSLGNKLALNDEEIDKVIKQIDDKFGPGTVVPASELPPKEDPYKDFMDRNPAADGGMIRKNFAAAGLALPFLSYPASFGLAKAFGLTTAGIGAKELGEKVTNYIQENPKVLETPQAKAILLSMGHKANKIIIRQRNA